MPRIHSPTVYPCQCEFCTDKRWGCVSVAPMPFLFFNLAHLRQASDGTEGASSYAKNSRKQQCLLYLHPDDFVFEVTFVAHRRFFDAGHQANVILSKHHWLFFFSPYSLLSAYPMKRVSVVLPNYNYAQYLEQRFHSIFAQTYPVFEIIVLDDASSDNSVEVIKSCLTETKIRSLFVRGERNSGSVFQQWIKGISLAQGDFIWICEADDLSDPTFLEGVMAKFEKEEDVVMAYSQSRKVDENGRLLTENYLRYTDGINTEKWKNDYLNDGKDELASALSIKNTIPNVSAVVFRKTALEISLHDCQDILMQLTVVGDWLIYANLLNHGSIGFVAESLNSHRCHEKSASMSSARQLQLTEILFLQHYVSQMVPLPHHVIEEAKTYIEKVSRGWGVSPDRNSSLFKEGC